MCFGAGGVPSSCVAGSLSELGDIRQLDSLFILYTLLAELSGPDSPAYTTCCLTAYAVVMQMWQVCDLLTVVFIISSSSSLLSLSIVDVADVYVRVTY